MENASSVLQCMEENGIDFKKAEYHWIGVASYNMGIMAQKEASLTRIIAFLQLSVLNLMTWVKNGDGDVLVKLQQVCCVLCLYKCLLWKCDSTLWCLIEGGLE